MNEKNFLERNIGKFLLCIIILGIGWWIYRSIVGDVTHRLIAAVEHNDIKKAKRMIEKGADVNAFRLRKISIRWPLTPLGRAINRSNAEMVELLLSKGASLKEIGTPGDIEQAPLDRSIDMMLSRATEDKGEVRLKQKDIIKLLMKAEAPTRYPRIIQAILSDNLDLVKQLTPDAQKSIKKNKQIEEYIGHAALFSGDVVMLDYVFTKILQADSSSKTSNWLVIAVDSDDEKILDYVLKLPHIDPKDPYVLDRAVIRRNKSLVKNLLDKGANPNLKNGSYSVLNTAVWRDKDIVVMLLKAGADVNIQDDWGMTPLMAAVEFANKEMVAFLLNAGANPFLQDKEGRTVRGRIDDRISIVENEQVKKDILKLLDDASARYKKP